MTSMTRATAIRTNARSHSCPRWTQPSTSLVISWGLELPAIVYHAVSEYADDGLRLWLRDQDPTCALSVFVGASNKPFSGWGGIFGDEVTAAAMIDRLVHHAEINALKGDSYRLK